MSAAEAKRLLLKYPERVPVLIFRAKDSDVAELDKHKYLVPQDLTVGQFQIVIRRRLGGGLRAEQALFLSVNNTLPPMAQIMMVLYKEHRNEDGFLMMEYSGENTFGG